MTLALLLTGIVFIFLIGYYGIPEVGKSVQRPTSSWMKDGEPIYKSGSRKTGVVLVHGFEATAFEMKWLAGKLTKKGYSVAAINLAGHGRSLDDLKMTGYPDWLESVSAAVADMRKITKKVALVGFSLGGNLSLRFTAEASVQPDALVVISAPLFLNRFISGRLFVKDWRLWFSGWMPLLTDRMTKKPRAEKWESIAPWVGHRNAYATRSLHSLRKNLDRVIPLLPAIQCPVLVMHAVNDRTVPFENSLEILRRVGSQERQSWFFHTRDDSSGHLIVTHKDFREKVSARVAGFLEEQKCLP